MSGTFDPVTVLRAFAATLLLRGALLSVEPVYRWRQDRAEVEARKWEEESELCPICRVPMIHCVSFDLTCRHCFHEDCLRMAVARQRVGKKMYASLWSLDELCPVCMTHTWHWRSLPFHYRLHLVHLEIHCNMRVIRAMSDLGYVVYGGRDFKRDLFRYKRAYYHARGSRWIDRRVDEAP